ncbi:pyridoxal phosphate-dependent aminotransferase [Lactobacillus sp. LC28-10]|uniref:Pyridoxal phosphate-dependent aminotransferase n=1 Tax=Secundilactobacillus angelensis TaxID=2722706 RepID=A0ABX1KV10_9LACO|nr:pyridoxal phosphate-dependent aminotransferase [Secundilactobacillus angelensis]MCH5461443.1 pyridoxal phosphate-dependent aminotransferase [Secundilactobacillus angelensis]NLR17744.1 pyridoxal phosphate-dependent aminotransferase [Secundilactobacillus angelensis]
MKISQRAQQLQPSATMKVSAQAKKMIASGIDVINLGIGEPDFETPKNIEEAAINAIKAGKASFYTPAAGIPQLRTAVADRTASDYHLQGLTAQNVAITTGAKMALFSAFQTILDPGDEVLLPEPYWVSYSEQIKLAGGVPVAVPVGDSFKATPADLESKLTDKTVAFVLNSPENPTGVIYDQSDLTALNDWTKKHDIMVITDDIYGQLVYNGAGFTSIAQLSDHLDPRIIIISGGSKTYSMTGWRMGYVVADDQLISKISAFLSHATGNPTAVSQYALLEAFTGDQSQTEVMRKAFEDRLNTIYPLLNDIPGFKLQIKPQGAFYLFPDVSDALKLSGIATAGELVSRLLTEAHVALVDGSAFGVANHVRISYATDLESLKTAMARIKAFMVQFKN